MNITVFFLQDFISLKTNQTPLDLSKFYLVLESGYFFFGWFSIDFMSAYL
jgi:hypothetical protein